MASFDKKELVEGIRSVSIDSIIFYYREGSKYSMYRISSDLFVVCAESTKNTWVKIVNTHKASLIIAGKENPLITKVKVRYSNGVKSVRSGLSGLCCCVYTSENEVVRQNKDLSFLYEYKYDDFGDKEYSRLIKEYDSIRLNIKKEDGVRSPNGIRYFLLRFMKVYYSKNNYDFYLCNMEVSEVTGSGIIINEDAEMKGVFKGHIPVQAFAIKSLAKKVFVD